MKSTEEQKGQSEDEQKSEILDTLSQLKDKTVKTGKKLKQNLEQKVAREKAKIQKEMGEADLKSSVEYYKQKTRSGFNRFRKNPLGTIGKAMLKGSAKTTTYVTKKSGRSLTHKIKERADQALQSLKDKASGAVSEQVAKKGLNGMDKAEQIAFASSYLLAKKVGLAVEAGKTIWGKLKREATAATMKKVYESYLPGSDVLVSKAVQFYDNDTDNMHLGGEDGDVSYGISSTTTKRVTGKLKSFQVNTQYKHTAETTGEVIRVSLDLKYADCNRNKSKETVKKELDTLVQQAIRDLDALENVREISKDGSINFEAEGREAKSSYTYKISKNGRHAAGDGVEISLFYLPLKKSDPSINVTYGMYSKQVASPGLGGEMV